MSNYKIKCGMITNNIKCRFGLQYCDGHVKAIETDILLGYFEVQMQKISNRQIYMKR
jgi:hypothetical protein